MAQITKRNGKKGISYLIRVSSGYSIDGAQRRSSKTWTPPAGMSEKKADREAQKEAIRFEDEINAGKMSGNNIKFQLFAKKWLNEYAKKQLKIKTWSEYEKQLVRINQAIGHLKIKDIRTGHLNSFYNNLQEDGLNQRTKGKLSPATVRIYHRLISSILGKAVKWGYIPFNPAAKATLPKLENKEAVYLDETDAKRLLELLRNEPIKWRTMVTFDLLSGLRRGELLGLRWVDIDFQTQTIQLDQASYYISGHGIITDTPKNKTSKRPLKLSRSAFILLNEYKQWQDEQKNLCAEYWKDKDNRVFTGNEGAPIHPDSLTKWFSKFVKRLGLPPVHIHSLRHTYASLMIADGTPLVIVSKRLGHAQVSTTANIYAHVIQSADEKAALVTEKFADLIAPQKNFNKPQISHKKLFLRYKTQKI
ncbi:MAG: site-specific integrase [Syntrophomonadaceae bacterium]|jgi:integrase|nr:site-specific integrase [Syntrophomonadaceae bacterium]